jgi:hypothetical protein
MKKDKTIGVLLLGYVALSFFVFTMFSKISTLFMVPEIMTQAYIDQWPYYKFNDLIIQQPSSSIIILILTFVTVGLGIHYLLSKKTRFAYWIGVNFIFWGLGAFFAGISYQAFGYALKCAGLPRCTFTNWVELLYMTLTVISINAILMAYASLIRDYNKAILLKRMALLSIVIYTIFQGLGMLIPVQFMISYEGMLLFLSPNIVIFMVLSYRLRTEELHHRLLILWMTFIGINLAYFVALYAGIGTLIMKSTGLWFNENDTLHVLLIIWMLAWWIMIPAHAFKQPVDVLKNDE